ncbi:autotransporter outer membrane beta-barrel domain-containing protein, partial [Klebsiella pneumoniae]|nr:autotransporter outer membrane beta-barrel domain-containing protein [Klebsiella pneumoniae]
TAKDNTNGIGFSVEGGKHITAGSYFIEPYVLGSYFRGEKTAYRFSSDMKVKADAAESVKGEIGTTFGKTFVTESGGLIKPYARLAVSHEFKKNNDVVINDTE